MQQKMVVNIQEKIYIQEFYRDSDNLTIYKIECGLYKHDFCKNEVSPIPSVFNRKF